MGAGDALGRPHAQCFAGSEFPCSPWILQHSPLQNEGSPGSLTCPCHPCHADARWHPESRPPQRCMVKGRQSTVGGSVCQVGRRFDNRKIWLYLRARFSMNTTLGVFLLKTSMVSCSSCAQRCQSLHYASWDEHAQHAWSAQEHTCDSQLQAWTLPACRHARGVRAMPKTTQVAAEND